ncbi:TMEM175 family protein [Aquibacillus rhizosphaerae]|uniref:Uncharacterized protein n=1 Tax=Aquibacillus rhizosphaerae TaxID=3051431 RepID=A0ABT7LAD8_9BACI|nr:hypothetical protein [Aquibacillus sp. LR5S19]MDL4842823.1 hypothetical protein [Aquibacillus sp. LR5S19]
MNEERYKALVERAKEIAKKTIDENIRGQFNDTRLEALSDAIITSSAAIAAQLIVEHDVNKDKE